MLSRRRQISPVKENISPDRHQLSPQRQSNVVKHLILLLKQHNIPIPQQFLQKATKIKSKNSSQFKLTQVLCDTTSQLKNMKMQLSDAKFQLKKIDEDFAEYKVKSRMQKDKLIKKYLTQIEQLKKKIQEDNSNWEKRYFETCSQFTKEKTIYKEKLNSQCQLKIHQQSAFFKNKYQEKIDELTTKVETLTESIQQKQKLYEKEKQIIAAKYQEKSKIEIQILKENTTEKQKEATEKLQHKIEAIELERQIDSKNFQAIIQKQEKDIKKLENDCYFVGKEKDELNSELKARQRKILQLQIAIRAKEDVLVKNKEEFQEQKVKINKELEIKIKRLKQHHLKQIQQIKRQHLNEIDGYYLRLNNLQQRKLSIESQYKEEMKRMEQKFSERISKNEDLEKIERLNTILMSREREIQRYQEDLKQSERIRENNDKNYNKLFNTARRKSSAHKDRQSIIKQSNTTDLKVLLKICNKQF